MVSKLLERVQKSSSSELIKCGVEEGIVTDIKVQNNSIIASFDSGRVWDQNGESYGL